MQNNIENSKSSRMSMNDEYRELLEEMGETPPSKNDDPPEDHNMMNNPKKIRITGLIFIAIVLALTFLLGLCFGAILSEKSADFWESVFRCCNITFLWFTAPGLITGILMLLLPFPGIVECYGVICGLYYGTYIAGAALSEWLNFPTVLSLIVAFILTIIVMIFGAALLSNN